MPTMQTIRPITFGMRFSTRLTAAISTVGIAFSDWNAERATRRELAKLSDLQLDDIGLTRGDIDALTR